MVRTSASRKLQQKQKKKHMTTSVSQKCETQKEIISSLQDLGVSMTHTNNNHPPDCQCFLKKVNLFLPTQPKLEDTAVDENKKA